MTSTDHDDGRSVTPTDRIGWRFVAGCVLALGTYSGFAIGYAVSAPDRLDTQMAGGLGDE